LSFIILTLFNFTFNLFFKREEEIENIYMFLDFFVGVEFIRPETGSMNRTPTLIQKQVGLSS